MFSTKIKNLVTRFKDKLPNSNFKRWEHSLYCQLVEETSFLPASASLGQRLWHVEHLTDEVPECEVCNNVVSWNDKPREYRKYCGPKCSASTDEVKQARANTMMERYDVPSYTQSPDFNTKRQQTYRKKYGRDWSLQSPEIREKIKKTTLEKYGAEVYTQSSDYKEKNAEQLNSQGIISSSQQRISPNSLKKLNNKQWLLQKHHVERNTITKIASELGVDKTTVVSRLNSFDIKLLRFSMSQGHMELLTEIRKFYSKPILVNERGILPSKKELDIYFPHEKLAIEYCGLFWHSADIHPRINKAYHKDKYDECLQQGITLLTFFEDEWFEKKDVIISMIKHKLHLTKISVPARKTTIKEISSMVAKEFFNKHHIQGDGPGSINVGLFYNNEVVAACTLIKTKKGLLLNRYATSCNVQGGFTKILCYVMQQYTPISITTFADQRVSSGELYTRSGFKVCKLLPPDYSYVVNGKRKHKFGFRHARLGKILKNYNPNETEVQNCLRAGLFRVWDCGKVKFVLE